MGRQQPPRQHTSTTTRKQRTCTRGTICRRTNHRGAPTLRTSPSCPGPPSMQGAHRRWCRVEQGSISTARGAPRAGRRWVIGLPRPREGWSGRTKLHLFPAHAGCNAATVAQGVSLSGGMNCPVSVCGRSLLLFVFGRPTRLSNRSNKIARVFFTREPGRNRVAQLYRRVAVSIVLRAGRPRNPKPKLFTLRLLVASSLRRARPPPRLPARVYTTSGRPSWVTRRTMSAAASPPPTLTICGWVTCA